MGKFSFDIPADLSPAWAEATDGAWLSSGYDHWPIPSERNRANGKLILDRKDKESATLDLLFPESQGSRAVATSTLRPNAEPYHLTIELARGAINRLRNVVSAFASAGLTLPDDFNKGVLHCTAQFGRAVLGSSIAEKDIMGVGVISDALRVTDLIGDHLTEIRLDSRLESHGRLPTLFGCDLKEILNAEESAAYGESFNAVRLIPEWPFIEPAESQFRWSRLDPLVEWATARNLAISIGPIIDFSAGGIPQWLRAGQGDIPTLAAFMADCVGTVVDRYRGRVCSWQLFSGLNSFDLFGLGEEDRLRLAARLLESAREIDPQGSWSYRLCQPYGEYLQNQQNTYSPLVFADTLLRSGHEVSAIALDLASSRPHDGIDFLQLLDNFETIMPTLEIDLGGFETRKDPALELSLLRAALSCKSVAAVYWQNWSELQSPNAPPRSMLYDLRENRPTSQLREFQALRSTWLN
jgi:hypothetical protein